MADLRGHNVIEIVAPGVLVALGAMVMYLDRRLGTREPVIDDPIRHVHYGHCNVADHEYENLDAGHRPEPRPLSE